jgi:hypothetical protein
MRSFVADSKYACSCTVAKNLLCPPSPPSHIKSPTTAYPAYKHQHTLCPQKQHLQLPTWHFIRNNAARQLIGNPALDNCQRTQIRDVAIPAIQQRDARDDVRGLEEMPVRERHLGARAYGDGEDVCWIQRAGVQGAEHVFICEIVSQTEGELGGLADLVAVGGDEALDDFAFVDEGGADFQVGFAGHDFDVPFLAHGVLEFFLAFSGHVGAEFGVRGAVMPG